MEAKYLLGRNRAGEFVTKTGSQAPVVLVVFSTKKRKDSGG